MRVTSTQFQQNVGRYQDSALTEPVVITKRNRPHTVLMSAAMFEVLAKGHVARPVEALDDETLRAIAAAAVPDWYAALDRLVDDWTP
jgi:prevent-host-death family protein